eukprot:RCo044780
MSKPSAPIQRPNADELNNAVNRIRARIDELKEQQRVLAARQQTDTEADRIRDEQKALRSEMDRMRVEIDEKKKKQEELRKEIQSIDSRRAELKGKQRQIDSAPCASPEEIAQRIKKLEFELETGSATTLKREAQIMNTIKRLEFKKKTIKPKEDLTDDLRSIDSTRSSLCEQMKQIQVEVEQIRDQRAKNFQQIQELQQKQNQGRDVAGQLRQERQALSDEIQKCYDEMRTIRDKFNADMTEWRRKVDEEREKETARRAAAEQARREKWQQVQEERARREAERMHAQREAARLRKLNPYEDEISACVGLIQYLTAELNPAAAAHKEKPKATPKELEHFDAAAHAKPGMTVFKRSEQEEDEWLMKSKKPKPAADKKPKQAPAKPKVAAAASAASASGSTSKGAPGAKAAAGSPASSKPAAKAAPSTSSAPTAAPATAPAPAPADAQEVAAKPSAVEKPQPAGRQKADRMLTAMPIIRLHAFDKIGVAIPLRRSEISSCLEELNKRKAYFESFRKTMEQVIAEEEQEELRKREALVRATQQEPEPVAEASTEAAPPQHSAESRELDLPPQEPLHDQADDAEPVETTGSLPTNGQEGDKDDAVIEGREVSQSGSEVDEFRPSGGESDADSASCSPHPEPLVPSDTSAAAGEPFSDGVVSCDPASAVEHSPSPVTEAPELPVE